MLRIPFNKPFLTGRETDYIRQAVESGKISGNGAFTQKCQRFFEQRYGFRKVLLTTSCTDALEMAAILSDVGPGDEVIVPSFTFVSSALAFVRQGAKIVFADSRPDNPNLDLRKVAALITPRTRVLVVVHYAGVACDMEAAMALAAKYRLLVVEDAAQAIDATYRGRPLGGLGHLGCFSFHETKNIIAGEGGALAINDERFMRRAEIIWEKGTNRAEFFRGEVNKYGWVDTGSSFLPSEIIAAFLWAQLEEAESVTQGRLRSWQIYHDLLAPLEDQARLRRPIVPAECSHNAHMYYILLPDTPTRDGLMHELRGRGIYAVFHYVPLHSSPAGRRLGRTPQELPVTDSVAGRLLRLPLWSGISVDEQATVVSAIADYLQRA